MPDIDRKRQAVTLADTRTIRPRSAADRRSGAAPLAAITLGGVGPPADVDLFLANAQDWDGPKVCVMFHSLCVVSTLARTLYIVDLVSREVA